MASNKNEKYQFLLDYFIAREGEQIADTLFEIDLIQSGIIDSLDIIEIAVIIEKNTGIKIDLSKKENFESMRKLPNIIRMISE